MFKKSLSRNFSNSLLKLNFSQEYALKSCSRGVRKQEHAHPPKKRKMFIRISLKLWQKKIPVYGKKEIPVSHINNKRYAAFPKSKYKSK